jgi:predicted transcriptional regulator
MKTATISFRTKKSYKEKLDKIAYTQDRNRSFVINQAIDDYFTYYQEKMNRIKLGEKQIKEGKVYSEKIWRKALAR